VVSNAMCGDDFEMATILRSGANGLTPANTPNS
jgi:hypothetical protein